MSKDTDTLNDIAAHVTRHEALISILYDHIINGDRELLRVLQADADFHFRSLHLVTSPADLAIDQKARSLVAQFFRELANALETKEPPKQD